MTETQYESPEIGKDERESSVSRTLAAMASDTFGVRDEAKAILVEDFTSFRIERAIEWAGKAQWFEVLVMIVERDGMTPVEAARVVLERARGHLESYFGSHLSSSGVGNLMTDAEMAGAAYFIREVGPYVEVDA